MLRSLAWCLGLGAASTALTLGTGGAAAPLAAALVGAVTGGAAGNFGHEVCKALDQRVVGALFERRSGIAENHVVTQALRLAQLKALRTVLERFDIARASDRDAAWREEGQRFSTELAKFIAKQQADAEALAFTGQDGVTPREEELKRAVLDSLPQAFDQSLAARRRAGDRAAIEESLCQIRRTIETAVLAELRLALLAPGEEPPSPFLAIFAGIAVPDGWFDLFIRDAADHIKDARGKDGGAFDKIWDTEQLALVKAIAETHTAILLEINERARRIEQGQTEQTARLVL